MERNIFLSHSPKDRIILQRIKDAIDKRTAKTLKIFLSSDGQSIPFGANWVVAIENALKNTKLMFVAITPNSLNSKWIHFEAGYACARDIKVIPIAFDGANINDLEPPLKHLQGFNIESKEAFANIFSIINSEYGCQISGALDDEEFNLIMSREVTTGRSLYEFGISNISCAMPIVEGWTEKIQDFMLRTGSEVFARANAIESYGLSVQIQDNYITAVIDPLQYNQYVELFDFLREMSGNAAKLMFEYGSEYKELNTREWLTSRIANSAITMSEDGLMFGDNEIDISHHTRIILGEKPIRAIRGATYVSLSLKKHTAKSIDVISLLRCIADRGIVYEKE